MLPIGTACIGRMFDTFGWSGSNLGGPAANQVELPCAGLDWLVHVLGGSGALALRVWLTLLIAGIFMAGTSLARSLNMSPMAGVVVGVAFFLNPMTMTPGLLTWIPTGFCKSASDLEELFRK